jgi:glyoxalase superfamily protein
MARFQELCLDTANPGSDIAGFWATVSGGELAPADDAGPGTVSGRTEQQRILVSAVPEPKTVKNRIHLDIYARAIDDLTALGAVVDIPAGESGFGWTVMLDPEGNEFCAFLRSDNDQELPAYRVHGIGVDSADAESQAAWWGAAFGARVDDNAEHGGGWWTLLGATDDPVLTIDFAPVPEPKTVKNRMHWHVRGSVEEFLDRGATRLWEMPRWTVLADPEGNEFCVFPET